MALKSLFLAKPITSIFGARYESPASLSVRRFGLTFSNPVGLAAGFDKDGVALKQLAALGFGHIEAGTVTYYAQPGNPRPRLFRLPKDQALINRAGFNNGGAVAFVEHVRGNRPDCVLGVSLGKSKITPIENAIEDYVKSFELVYELADYIAINVSSPNTPRLRELQQEDHLKSLLSSLQARNVEMQTQKNRSQPVPLLVKLAPDLSSTDLELIVDVVLQHKIDGIIATNTTISREQLKSTSEEVSACGEGGLSGQPLRKRSTEFIAQISRLSNGRIPIIGVGGIFTAEDAWEKIGAGASLVQLYTGFIYQGPFIARRINEGLIRIMNREGFKTLEEAVGHKTQIRA